MILNASDKAVVYHFLCQVSVITHLSQVVEASYKLHNSFVLLNVVIELGPFKDDVSTYLKEATELVHYGTPSATKWDPKL